MNNEQRNKLTNEDSQECEVSGQTPINIVHCDGPSHQRDHHEYDLAVVKTQCLAVEQRILSYKHDLVDFGCGNPQFSHKNYVRSVQTDISYSQKPQ